MKLIKSILTVMTLALALVFITACGASKNSNASNTISNLEINLQKILESRLNMFPLTQPTVQST